MLKGATVSASDLIGLKAHASGIVPTLRSKVYGQLVGQSSARSRGRGLDFQEVRHYQPGDELRSIDWRVTARTGHPHTKLFYEERERPVLLVVDQRSTMQFGSQHCFKSVQACATASLLGWASLYNHDRVGSLIFNDTQHTEHRPSSNTRNFLHWLKTLAEYAALSTAPSASNESAVTNQQIFTLADVTAEIRQLSKPGTSIFIISDFSGFNDDCFAQLSQIRRHCDVTTIRIHDAMEANLPNVSRANFSDGQRNFQVDNLNALSPRFAHRNQQWRNDLVEQLAKLKIATIEIATAENTRAVLEKHFLKTPRRSRIKEVLHG